MTNNTTDQSTATDNQPTENVVFVPAPSIPQSAPMIDGSIIPLLVIMIVVMIMLLRQVMILRKYKERLTWLLANGVAVDGMWNIPQLTAKDAAARDSKKSIQFIDMYSQQE